MRNETENRWFPRPFHSRTVATYFVTLLLLLAFAVAINTIIIRRSQDALRRECSKSNEFQAYRFSVAIDELIKNADASMVRLENSAYFYRIIYPMAAEKQRGDMNTVTLLDIRNVLRLQKRQDQHDLFLYFKNSGVVVSAEFSLASAPLYYRVNYRSDRLPCDEWLEACGQVSGKGIALFYSGNDAYLACVRSMPTTLVRSSPIACVTVYSDRVIRAMMNNAMQAESLMSVYSKDGQLMFSTDAALAERMDISTLAHNAAYMAGEGGNRYHVFVIQSEETGCFYVSAMPETVFLAPFLSTQRFQTLMNAVLIVLGFFLALLLAGKLYKPVKETIRIARIDSPVAVEAKNDFEYLQQAIRYSQSQRIEMQSRINEHSTVLQRYFLYEAMMGRVAGSQPTKALFDKYQLPCVSNFFSVVIAKRSEDDAQGEPIESLLPACLEKERITCRSVTGMEPLMVFLMNYIPDASADRIPNLLRRFQQQHRCAICCSDCFQGIAGIHQGYRQAQKLDEYTVIYGNTKVITSAELNGSTDFAPNEGFSVSAKTAIYNSLRASDRDADELFDLLLRQYMNGNRVSPFAARCFINDLSLILYQSVSRHCADETVRAARQILYSSIPASLIRFRKLFHDAWAIAREDYRASHAKETLFHRVDAYLEENYQDASLGVGTMDGLFGLSSGALSESYRQETGQSIGDALTQIRMRRACELLRDTDMPLEEIAQRVGIIGSSSLIRLFKKTQGTTPGAYRRERGKKGEA